MAGHPYLIPFHWRNAAATVVLAGVIWGLPFMLWPYGGGTRGPAPVRMAMKIKFLGAVQGVDGSAWSPVVFPLPTKYGFSERADTSGMGHDMSQVFRPRAAAGVFLELPLPVVPVVDVGILEGTGGESSFRPAGVAAPVFGNGAVTEAEPWRMEADDVLKERRFSVEGLKEVVPEGGGRGSLEAYVELDRGGVPLHVLLDGSSGNTNLDRVVVRLLYAGRGQRGPAPVGGRVRLFYWRPGNGVAEEGGGSR